MMTPIPEPLFIAQKIRSLDEAVDVLEVDDETKDDLRKQLKELQTLSQETTAAELHRQEEEFRLRIDIERSQFTTDRFLRLLDKDLVSVVIGGILLIFMSVALLFLIRSGSVEARLFESTFLILLGFFFGQGGASRGQRSDTTQNMVGSNVKTREGEN